MSVTLPHNAFAQEYLKFKEPETRKTAHIIQQLGDNLSQNALAPYLIATTDLNDDSIDEYLLKSKSCNDNTACPHTIIAIKNDKPITLLTIDASLIIVSDQQDYGVRRLIISENGTNDFQKSTYQWSPKSFTYNKQ